MALVGDQDQLGGLQRLHASSLTSLLSAVPPAAKGYVSLSRLTTRQILRQERFCAQAAMPWEPGTPKPIA
jgi:hypothetical protein